jgi:drug/metabolite transporter (DMT)-like permease
MNGSRDLGKGVRFGILTALSFAVLNFSVKISLGSLPPAELTFFRGLSGTILFLPIVKVKGSLLLRRDALSLWGRSMVSAVSIVCLFANIQTVGVGNAMALANVSTVFVLGLSWIFLKEKLSSFELLGVMIVLGGTGVLQSPFGADLPSSVFGIGILGAFLSSLSFMALRSVAGRYPVKLIVWIFSAMMSASSLLTPSQPWVLPGKEDLLTILIVTLCGILGQVFMTKTFSYLRAAVASVLVLSSIVWGMLLEAVFLGDLPSMGAVLGHLMIITGIMVVQFLGNYNYSSALTFLGEKGLVQFKSRSSQDLI